MSRPLPDPQSAYNTLARFEQIYGSLSSPKNEILTLLASYSRFLGRVVVKEPGILETLSNSRLLETKKAPQEITNEALDIARTSTSAKELMAGLRHYKYKELSRIIYRDILGLGSFVEIMEELSDLASGILEGVFNFFKNEVGHSGSGKFVIMGMGKLGGRELNLSSDIDLIYLYKDSEDPDPFFKLAERITKALSASTEDGFLYRVDLGLRPGGSKSLVAIPLEGALEHYFYWGDTWERAALLKARPVAGELSLGEEFIREIEPFIYKKHLDFASIEDLKDMKAKLDRIHKPRDVKLGRGGIREIEFFVQAHQLINGGEIKDIRERNTLRTLQKLQQRGIIKKDVFFKLNDSYEFLRRVEHAIQMVDELRVHALPEDPDELEKLAKRVGLKNKGELERVYEERTSQVSRTYESLFYDPSRRIEKEGRAFWELADFLTEGHVEEKEAIEELLRLGFRDPERALELINTLLDPKRGGLTQRGRSLSRKVVPAFLSKVVTSSNPDASLRNLERFVSSVGSRTSIYAVLAENPETLELLAKFFSTSGYLSNFLIKHPEYLDILTLRGVSREFASKEEMLRELKKTLDEERDYEDKLDAIRRFKHVETLKLCLQDLHHEVDPIYVGEYLTMLAESTLEMALSLAGKAVGEKYGRARAASDMVILGMGKFGGRELSYNSDLDLIFIYRGGAKEHEFFSKVGHKVISILSLPTKEGFAYKIDMDLRPSGRAGALVSSLEAFEKYHRESAKLWERQALIKARPVAGDPGLGEETMKIVSHFVYEDPLPYDFHREIDRLRDRMERELAKENALRHNLKSGRGGIVDIEFTIQMLQLKYGCSYPEVRRQSTFKALQGLADKRIIDENTFKTLYEGLYFLKELENLLRLLHDRSTSELLESDFRKLALELEGEESGEKLKGKYILKTKAIRSIYERYFS